MRKARPRLRSGLPQRERDGRALGEILNPRCPGPGPERRGAEWGPTGRPERRRCPPPFLRDVCMAMASTSRALRWPDSSRGHRRKARRQAWESGVHGRQKEDPQGGAAGGGEPAGEAGLLRRLDGGKSAGTTCWRAIITPAAKPSRSLVEPAADPLPEQKDGGGSQPSHEKGEAGAAGSRRKVRVSKQMSFPGAGELGQAPGRCDGYVPVQTMPPRGEVRRALGGESMSGKCKKFYQKH